MSESGLQLRDVAVPFISWTDTVFSHDMENTDLYTMPLITNGDLIEAYLTLFMSVDSSLSLRIAVGEWKDTEVEPVESYSSDYIKKSHARITGNENTIDSSSGFLFVDGANLLHERKKFNEHGFVLILEWSRTVTRDEFDTRDLIVNCSTTLGLK